MKKIILFVYFFSIFFTRQTMAQVWTSALENKNTSNFYSIQKAFNDYNLKNKIYKGYYNLPNGSKIKTPGWKQFKRQEWFWEQRINPSTGEFPQENSIEVYNKFNRKKNSAQGNWQNIGANYTKGGYAGLGRINCVAFHPSDTSTYWIGTPAGGIWQTSDDGANWKVLSDNNTVLGVSSIAIPSDYATSKTIYIATGDRDGGSMSVLGGSKNDNNSIGVLKSTDGGYTWQTTTLSYSVSEGEMVYKIMMHPTDDNIIFAATSTGFYKSVDKAATWTKLSTNSYIDFEFKPANPQIIYASTQSWYYTKIYKSVDGGTNWQQIQSKSGSRTELAVSPADSSLVYAIVANSSGGLEGIYKSTDSGDSYSQLVNGDDANKSFLGYYSDGSGDNTGQGDYDLCMAVSPTDANKVYFGGINSWKTNDGGQTWEIMNMWTSYATYNKSNAPTIHADKHYMIFRGNSDVLFETNDGGIYKSFNHGTKWINKTNGLTISQVYRLSSAQTQKDIVITGLQDNGSKLLWNSNWYDVTGGDGMECAIDPTNENIEYATYAQGELYRTNDMWDTQTTISDNIGGGSLSGAWVTPFVLNPLNHNTIFVAYEDLWVSRDTGSTFTKISSFASDFGNTTTLKVLDIFKQDSLVILTGTRTDLFITTDGGTSWKDITNNLPSSSNSITNVLFDANDKNQIWVSLGSYSGNQIYETSDGGANWTNISNGLPDIPAMCIIQNKRNTQTTELYIGMDVGVYVKYGSNDWQVFNQNLPNVVVSDLAIYYDKNDNTASRLYAATFGRGVWSSDLYDPNSIQNPKNFTAALKTNNSIDLKWKLNPNNDKIILAYNETGVFGTPESKKVYIPGLLINGGGTVIYTGNDTIFLHENLKLGTNYYYKIWTLTNDTLYSSGVFTSAETVMQAQSLPYFENFDAANMPQNTSIQNESGATDRWTIENTKLAGATPNELVATFEDVVGSSRFILPLLDMSNSNNLYISYIYSLDDYSAGMQLELQTSTDKMNWKTIDTIVASGNSDITAKKDSLSITAPFGSTPCYFAFTVTGDLYSFDYVYIDSINIGKEVNLKAPVWQEIPKQEILVTENFNRLDLNSYVSDDNTPDSQLNFNFKGNNHISITINNGLASFQKLSNSWTGTDTLVFTATDNDNFSSSQTVLFTIKTANQAPQIQNIPNQTILKGEEFNSLSLNYFVSDDYTTPDSIKWTIKGTYISTTIQNQVAHFTALDSTWEGTDSLTFTAEDEYGGKDSVKVAFTIQHINQAPVISSIPSQTINNGENFSNISLNNYVSDEETADSLIKWSYYGNTNLSLSITNQVLTISPISSSWYGTETIYLIAEDEEKASDTISVNFTINNSNSISTINNNSEIQIYPNPSSGIFHINLLNKNWFGAELYIYDLKGQELFKKSLSEKETQINLNNWNKGIYLIKLKSKDKIVSQKLFLK